MLNMSRYAKSSRKAMNRNWSNQKANPALDLYRCQDILKMFIKSLHIIVAPFIFFNLIYEIRDNSDEL